MTVVRRHFNAIAFGFGLLLAVGIACWAIAVEVKKDVPYIATPEPVVAAMLKLAKPKKGEVLYDLGCGDGRIVVTAAKQFGVRGVGIDIDPERIAESNENARNASVTERVRFVVGDLFEMDLHDADIITLFLRDDLNERLRPRLFEQLKPGSRVVSHRFAMGDWKPDAVVTVQPGGQTVYFWVIPARVGGIWRIQFPADGDAAGKRSRDAKLKLRQQYQAVTGTARLGEESVALKDVSLRGTQLTFTVPAGQRAAGTYTATVRDNAMTGTSAQGEKFTASRIPASELNILKERQQEGLR